MAIVGAVMHKLIRIVYGVLSWGQAYDPQKLLPSTSTPETAWHPYPNTVPTIIHQTVWYFISRLIP